MEDSNEKVESEHPEMRNQPADSKADIDLARLLGRVLSLAAQRVGVPQGDDLRSLCDSLIGAARGGRLDPLEYRLVYWLRFGGSFGPAGRRG